MSDTDKEGAGSGAVERKCSKCGQPCRGHKGPYGSGCTNTTDTTYIDGGVDTNTSCAEQMTTLIPALVEQMAALNFNIQGVLQGQQEIRRAMSGPPPWVDVATPRSADPRGDINIQECPQETKPTTVLPNGVRITEKAAKCALTGEFVNLSDFLPITDSKIDADLEPIVNTDGQLTFRAPKSKRAIDSLAQWMAAWNTRLPRGFGMPWRSHMIMSGSH